MHEDENKQLHVLFPGNPDLVLYPLTGLPFPESWDRKHHPAKRIVGVIISTKDRARA